MCSIGVFSAVVTLISKKGLVEFDESIISSDEIANCVEELGYDVKYNEISDIYQIAELEV